MLSSVKVHGPLPGSTPGGAERRVCRAGTPATPWCLAKYTQCKGKSPPSGIHALQIHLQAAAGTQPARWTLLPRPRVPRGAGTLTVSQSRWDAALSLHTEDNMVTPQNSSFQYIQNLLSSDSASLPPAHGRVQ